MNSVRATRLVAVALFVVAFTILNIVVKEEQMIMSSRKKRILSSFSDVLIGTFTSSSSERIKTSDKIITPHRWGNPIVIHEYKLVFFPIPGAGNTEWKFLLRRMLGLPDEEPRIHNPKYNGLTYLSDFTREEAQEMMTSDEWTRAVFVREPKQRILSTFMEMFVDKRFFADRCCDEHFEDNEWEQLYCWSRLLSADFTYFLNRTLDCPDPHWTPQSDAIDDKWWPYMTFVGYMHSAASDAERLLNSLTAERSTITAWEKFGKSGWGEDGRRAFLHEIDSDAYAEELQEIYTKCHEAFVEKHWAVEWGHPIYDFEKTHLFDHADLSDCEIH